VLRFWNIQVLQEIEDVLEAIWLALGVEKPSGPHPALPREGGG
jgi:very-short-patch-repair endonuclease